MDITIYGFSVDLTILLINIDCCLSQNNNPEVICNNFKEYNKKLYESSQEYLFGETGILNNICNGYIKFFKNGFMYIGFELNKQEMCNNGIVINDYFFGDLLPLIDNIKNPRIFRFTQ